jgi:hypothetical protein
MTMDFHRPGNRPAPQNVMRLKPASDIKALSVAREKNLM